MIILEQTVANFLATGELPQAFKDRTALLTALSYLALTLIEPVTDQPDQPDKTISTN